MNGDGAVALITRFSTLLRADAHAVLDATQSPVAVLRQAVRDMHIETQSGQRQVTAIQQALNAIATD